MSCTHIFADCEYAHYVQCTKCFTLKSTAPEKPEQLYTEAYWSGYHSTPEAQIYNIDVHLERGVTKSNYLLSQIRVSRRDAAIDIGCFPGIFLKRLQEYGFTYVLGVDAIAIPNRLLHLQGVTTPVLKGFFPGVALDPATFDLVTSADVFEHVPDPVGFLAECYRVCAPGGQLLLVTPLIRNQTVEPRMLAPAEHVYIHSVEDIQEMVKDAGFHSVRVTDWTAGHDVISARKT